VPEIVRRHGLRPRRFLGPHLWLAPVKLPRRDGWRAYILHAPMGYRFPLHRHTGPEFMQVLGGAVHDGATYTAGDFARGETLSEHRVEVIGDGPCAALVASFGGADWDGPLRFAAPLLGV
jgi:putative transcriptional regulator